MRAVWLLFRLAAKGLQALVTPPAQLFQALYQRLAALYVPVLRWSLGNRFAVLLFALLLLGASLALIPRIGIELIPSLVQGEFSAELRLPAGTPLAQTDARTGRLADGLNEETWVQRVYTVIGTGNRLDADPDAGGEESASINLLLSPAAAGQAEQALQALLRERFASEPGIEFRFTRPTLFSLEVPLVIEVAGWDLERIRAVAETLKRELSAERRFRDVESSLRHAYPEIRIRFDQERAARLGVDVHVIAERIVNKVQGAVATRFRLPDREIDVLVRAQEQDRAGIEALRRLIINPQSERPLPLSAVADVVQVQGDAEIRRIDQQRVALISAELAYGDLGTAAEVAKGLISRQQLPEGVSVRVAGQHEEMQVSYQSLQLALALAVFLVYLVMASQFESLLHPFVILFSIPLALIGAVAGLYVTGTSISVIVLIGLIVLAGIVVNNGIVLVDLVNRLRSEGLARDSALLQAGSTRLRPILMTTLTTSLGLLPLALGSGEGVEIRAPLAVTVIGGLTVSMLLTLVVIPVIYSLLDRRRLPQDEAGALALDTGGSGT